MRNTYEVRGDTTAILLDSQKFGKMETLISTNKLNSVVGDLKWFAMLDVSTNKFYCGRNSSNRTGLNKTSIHRLITNCPANFVVDHINHNTLDNRDENLRVITSSDNCQNRKGAQKNSVSGLRGVYWNAKSNKWHGVCMVKGRKIYTGYSSDKYEVEKELIKIRRSVMPFSSADQIKESTTGMEPSKDMVDNLSIEAMGW